jgi:hypothetical protein
MARRLDKMMHTEKYDFPRKNYQSDHVMVSSVMPDASITLVDTTVEGALAIGEIGDLHEELTPMVVDVSGTGWRVWGFADAAVEGFMLSHDGLSGRLYGRAQLDKTLHTQQQIMTKGQVNFPDLVVPAGSTATQLANACATTLRERGITVNNLPDGIIFH